MTMMSTQHVVLASTIACGLVLAFMWRQMIMKSEHAREGSAPPSLSPAKVADTASAASIPFEDAAVASEVNAAEQSINDSLNGSQKSRQKRVKPQSKPVDDSLASESSAIAAVQAKEVRVAVQAEATRRAKVAAAASSPTSPQNASARNGEAEQSEGETFVNAIVNRSVLTQPFDLSKEAQPVATKKGKDASSKKLKKPKPLSSWAEAFIEAMQVLEGSEAEATTLAQHRLNAVLASAAKPGAPREALPITLRAVGYIAASTSHLDRAEVRHGAAPRPAHECAWGEKVKLGWM